MRIFVGISWGGGVSCQTTISVHAYVRYFEHERTFTINLLALSVVSRMKRKVADVGMNT